MHVNVGSIGHVDGGHPLRRLRNATVLAFAIATVNAGKSLYHARQTGKTGLVEMFHSYHRFLEEMQEEPIYPIFEPSYTEQRVKVHDGDRYLTQGLDFQINESGYLEVYHREVLGLTVSYAVNCNVRKSIGAIKNILPLHYPSAIH